MGKMSDALKKVMEEREKQRQQDLAGSSGVSVATESEPEPVARREVSLKEPPTPYRKTPQEVVSSKKNNLEEFLKRRRDRFYVAKATDNSGIDPRVVTYFDYSSPLSEQYRILRTNVKSYLTKKSTFHKVTSVKPVASPRILTLTSSVQGEGKTITAANLAVCLAHDLECKILLVDCDLRRGSIHALFNVNPKPGLSDILTGKVQPQEAIVPTKIPNLFVIPGGQAPHNPSELLGSKKMRAAIEALKSESFSYIILDTPPLLPFTDAGVLGTQTDGVILVVQAQRTHAPVVKKAKELLGQAHAKLLGFVLTKADYYIPDFYSRYYSSNHRGNSTHTQ
ncbi:MAG: CpsD/CapB family tyrosine-protein kinase [Candidatus Omnitrophota bacterium]|nr:MAG: CpsD/CapB family tyrosine-protein kinase [Candidatus Omnitrophota bacterium]